MQDVKIIIPGRFGGIRARNPWARPKSHGMTSKGDDVWAQKAREVESVVTRFESECGNWFYSKFNGRFSQLESSKRPSVRIMFTEKDQPFQDERRGPLTPAGLGWSWQVYESHRKFDNGWWLSINDPERNDGKHVWTVAARRADAGNLDRPNKQGTTNWSLTQRFGTNQAGLVAIQAIQALLDEFGGELARLRDQSHHRRRFARPVADARKLNRYLLTDGLDASTIGPDVVLLTKSPQLFGWGLPAYTEYQGSSDRRRNRPPAELVPSLRRTLRSQAKTLGRKSKETDRYLRASAELRQAVSNTRMQRVVVTFTIVAVMIAVLSLLIALTSSST